MYTSYESNINGIINLLGASDELLRSGKVFFVKFGRGGNVSEVMFRFECLGCNKHLISCSTGIEWTVFSRHHALRVIHHNMAIFGNARLSKGY